MKTRLLGLVGLVLVVMGLAMSAAAQDTEPACSVNDVLNTEYQGMVQRDWLDMVITTLNANIEDDDATNFLGTARELRNVLSRLDADCRGLHFTSADEGMLPLIGPVNFENGLWRVTFTTAGYGAVKIETLAGTCESDYGVLFNVSPGEADKGGQAVFKTSEGCEALIGLENTSEDWDLIFELLKATDG
jgi:hypothetical protein